MTARNLISDQETAEQYILIEEEVPKKTSSESERQAAFYVFWNEIQNSAFRSYEMHRPRASKIREGDSIIVRVESQMFVALTFSTEKRFWFFLYRYLLSKREGSQKRLVSIKGEDTVAYPRLVMTWPQFPGLQKLYYKEVWLRLKFEKFTRVGRNFTRPVKVVAAVEGCVQAPIEPSIEEQWQEIVSYGDDHVWLEAPQVIQETEEVKKRVRSGNCLLCNMSDNLTRHHLFPRSQRAAHPTCFYHFNRTVLLCRSCHSAVHIWRSNDFLARNCHYAHTLLEHWRTSMGEKEFQSIQVVSVHEKKKKDRKKSKAVVTFGVPSVLDGWHCAQSQQAFFLKQQFPPKREKTVLSVENLSPGSALPYSSRFSFSFALQESTLGFQRYIEEIDFNYVRRIIPKFCVFPYELKYSLLQSVSLYHMCMKKLTLMDRFREVPAYMLLYVLSQCPSRDETYLMLGLLAVGVVTGICQMDEVLVHLRHRLSQITGLFSFEHFRDVSQDCLAFVFGYERSFKESSELELMEHMTPLCGTFELAQERICLHIEKRSMLREALAQIDSLLKSSFGDKKWDFFCEAIKESKFPRVWVMLKNAGGKCEIMI